MSSSDLPFADLRAESRSLSRYLIGKEPNAAAIGGYVDGHGSIPYLASGGSMALVDRVLLRSARRGVFAARAADAYSRLFRPGSPLRQKLILMLAVLESTPPFHRELNRTRGVGTSRAMVGLSVQAGIFMAALALGVLCFGPIHLASRETRGRRG